MTEQLILLCTQAFLCCTMFYRPIAINYLDAKVRLMSLCPLVHTLLVLFTLPYSAMGLPGGSVVKNLPAN